MKQKRLRCNIVGCMGWAYKGDCRCLKHIVMKYGGVWARNNSDRGHRILPIEVE